MSSYIEYILSNGNKNCNLEEKEIRLIMANVSQKCSASTSRLFTRYLYKDLVYEIGGNQVKTWRKTPVSIDVHVSSSNNREILEAKFNMDKIPCYMFPSTLQIYDNAVVTKTVYSLHKNVLINFETMTFDTTNDAISNGTTTTSVPTTVNKVFVSYNKDIKDDPDTVKLTIDRAISLLQWVPTWKTEH